MNRSRKVLTTGVLLGLLTLVSLFSFAPNLSAAEGDLTVEPDAVIAAPTSELEAVYRQREQTYMQQIETLHAAQLARQTTYQTQLSELTAQAAALQAQLDTLVAQEDALRQQLSQINVVRVERIVAYQSQLDQATAQYGAQQGQLQARLNDAQVKLTEANAMLGR